MKNLRWLDRIHPAVGETTSEESRSNAGDRAFYLSCIAQKGYPTLPGLVVSAQMLCDFLQGQTWQEPPFAQWLFSSEPLNVEDPSQLQTISSTIRQAIVSAELPSAWITALAEATSGWAVNSAIFCPSLSIPDRVGKDTQAHLSQLLNSHRAIVRPDDLALALKRVWAELFRARSLFGWQRYGIELWEIRLAVLVQPLEKAIASGSLEAHPSRIEIQATSGWGLFLSGGEVIPEIYQVCPQTGEVRVRRQGFSTQMYDLGETSVPLPEDRPGEEKSDRQWALSDRSLTSLIRLAKSLMVDFRSNFQLEWMLLAATPWNPDELASELLLYVIQVHPLDADVTETPMKSNNCDLSDRAAHPPQDRSSVMTGLAASGGVAIAPARTLAQLYQNGSPTPSPYILVAAQLDPDVFGFLQAAAGLVTERGGLTTHAAIFARELGIPAVVGVANATKRIQGGEWLHLDGDRGEVHFTDFPPSSAQSPPVPQALFPTPQNLATQLWVNLSQTSLLDRIATFPVDGVGLIRSELIANEVLDGQTFDEWIQAKRQEEYLARLATTLEKFARAFAPRPVFYRTFDGGILGRKADSALGVRGTWSYQLDPTLFDLELSAIARVRQQGCTNLHLILPFVRTVEEFNFCRRRVEQVGLNVGLTGSSSFQLWIMAEVPSAIFLLPDYIRAGVQGIAIGSNDLTQLILAAERDATPMEYRDDRRITEPLDARHPAVMRAIQQLIATARAEGIPCSICGDAPTRYPEPIDALVRWGITAISVSPDAVEFAARSIARAEKRLLLDAARRSLADSQ
ncbi:MAG: putative PEP-binding protein [Geitlerinemataceae cyanobacterium]